MEELNKVDYDHSNFVVDAGSISYVGPTALHYRHSRNFIFSPAQADMGCALPSALGVAGNSKSPLWFRGFSLGMNLFPSCDFHSI